MVSQKPSLASRFGFPIVAWGLAFHSLVMALLFGPFRIDENIVRALAAWKELCIPILAIIVLMRAVTGRGPGATVAWIDFWVAGMIALATILLLAGNNLFQLNLPDSAGYFGIRDAAYFLLLFFVGRGTPELADGRGMRVLVLLVLVTSAIGIVERIFVSPDLLVSIGVAAYFQDFLGVASFTVGNDYGLPLSYWAGIGGKMVRRAGSVYLSGQGFAVPFLLLFPLITSWLVLRAKRTMPQIFCYALACTALLLTLTRMTIIAAIIQLLLVVTMMKRPEWAVGAMAAAATGLVGALVLLPGLPGFLWDTVTLQESSSASHFNDLSNGLLAMMERPWGSGLGTADQTAVRAGLPHITGDNLYLKYGVEMGFIGLILLVLILGSVIPYALKLYRQGETEAQRQMGMTIFLATIGIFLNGMTAVVFNSISLGWLYFWLAGAVVTQTQRQRRSQELDVPSEIRRAA